MARDIAVGNIGKAIERARDICSDVPGEARYELHLAGLLRRQEGSQAASNRAEASAIYDALAQDTETTSSTLRAHARFELASMAMSRSNESEALAHIENILALPLADDERRRALVLRKILTHKGPAASSLRAIFWPDEGGDIDRLLLVGLAGEAAMLEPELGLAHYLLARQLRGRGSPAATVRAMRRALALPLAPLVQREAARMLAEAAYLAKDMQALTEAVTILVAPEQPQVIRLLGYDWLERAHWALHGTVPEAPIGWVDGKARTGMP